MSDVYALIESIPAADEPGSYRESWTKQHMEKLLELIPKGGTARDIAMELTNYFHKRFTRMMVLGKCHREGINLLGAPDPRTKWKLEGEPPKPERVIRRASPKHMQTTVPDRPLPPDPPAPPDAITIEHLTMGRCHWPIGDPRDFEAFRYCGHAAITPPNSKRERYYCDHHQSMAYTPGTARPMRKKEPSGQATSRPWS